MNIHNIYKHSNTCIRTPCSTKCSCSCDALFIEYLFPLISSQTDAQSLIIKCQSELLKCIQRVKSSATTTVYSTLMCWGSGFRVQRLVIDPEHGQFAGREPLVSLRLGRCRLPLDVQVHYSRGIWRGVKLFSDWSR